MIAAGARVRAQCDRCELTKPIDLAALAEKLGADYSLFNRRCRCKLRTGCTGWNRFVLLWGALPRHLWDSEAEARWLRSGL